LLAPTEPSGAADATSLAVTAAATPGTSDLVLAGTTNFLAKYVNAADVGDSAVYETGGMVGIGTTTPLDWTHVRFTNTNGATTGLAVQNLGNTATSYSGMLFYDQNGALGQFQGFNNVTHEYRINNIARVSPGGAFNGSINFMTGSTSRFFVATSGNVGIGTTAPGSTLDVSNAVVGTGQGNITASTFGAASSNIVGRRARGTAAAPTAVQNGDFLALFGGRGYGATAFGGGITGSVRVVANENWTDTAQGTRLGFATTPLGTATPVLRMVLDPSGNLGLGTIAPSAALEVVRETGTPLEVYLTRYGGISSSGEPNLMLRTARGTAAAPTAIQDGDELGGYGMTGYGATGFGEFGAGMAAFAAENWTDTAQGAVLAFGTTPLGSNEAQITMVTLPSGNTGIGLPTASGIPVISDKLEVFGDIRMGTTGTNGCLKNFAGTGLIGTCASDRRYKKDITPFSSVLDQLAALQPVHYFWRAADFPQQRFGDSRAYGLIAQDVETVLPELVVTNDDGFKAVDYTKLPLLTIQAVKELKAENDELRSTNGELKIETDGLRQRVAELERLFSEMQAKQLAQ
ncbi:MAG TPA: tail fiber domain-containing protein, partial [Vicinamibacterales bacterium]